MERVWRRARIVALIGLGCMAGAMAVEVPTSEWEHMKQEIAELKKGNAVAATPKAVAAALDTKYGPGATAVTKSGKLTVSGLLQVWYYSMQNDSHGFFDDPNVNGIADNNLANDINSFRIRRTELKFTLDVNECITGVIMFDPAREVGGYPAFPSNQGLIKKTATGNGGITGATFTGGFGGGTGSPPRLLQDAFINYHNFVPHHDFQVGQYKHWVGEEGPRSSSELDFAERSILGQLADTRDMGFTVHGSWWGKDCNDRDGRFQYWGAIFDGATTYYNPGNFQNRSDNNQSKDFNGRLLVRPLVSECMGNLELGASYIGGRHGPQANDETLYPAVTATTPIPQQTWASKSNVWLSYKFGKWFAKGLWVRSEWGWVRDRQEGAVIAFGNGNLGTGAALGLTQTALEPFDSQGGYASAGYRFGDASWVECMPCWLKSFEILARYEQFQNIETSNVGNPTRTSVFNTRVGTAGLNYYFSGNTKIQLNYNLVELPTGKSNGTRSFHDTQNNNFVVNFQVAF